MRKLKKKTQSKITESTKSGFTLVELSVVIGFVSLLLIAIAVITTNLIGLFQKGVTLGAINSVGRNLISELTYSINSAPSIDSTSLCNKFLSDTSAASCISDKAYRFIYQEEVGDMTDPVTGSTVTVQYNGVFCTGMYSYVWNTWYGQYAGNAHMLKVQYNTADGPQVEEGFNLVRFEDYNYLACQQRVGSNYSIKTGVSYDYDYHVINMRKRVNGTDIVMSSNPATDFIETAEANLSLYELVIFPVTQDQVTQRAFFSGTFILATGNGDVTIERADEACSVAVSEQQRLEADGRVEAGVGGSILTLDSGFNYCGINKFNFAARSAGSGV